jgi:diaminopimelate decarboxylase
MGSGGSTHWLRIPEDVDALVPALWPSGVSKVDGVLTVAGLTAAELAAEYGTPTYVVDELDFRERARAFRDAFGGVGADVFYAGKAFLCVAVARWIAEEGLNLDVCTGGELAVALRAEFPPARIAMHGNNKSVAELRRAIEAGVGRIIVDSTDEIDRLAKLTAELGTTAAVLIRVTPGVEAHTHEYIATAHEDQKFGFSISPASGEYPQGGSAAMAAVRQVIDIPSLTLLGLHSHIGSQIFDTDGFEVATRRVLGLHADIKGELGLELPELDLGGGFGVAYTTGDDPSTPKQLAAGMRAIVEAECDALGIAIPRLSVEPGRAIAGPSTFTLYEVGTVKDVELDGGATRKYVSVDGGMSDNIRPALYGADYSCTLASRSSSAEPVMSRVVGKHCESGDIVVYDEFLPADTRPGDLIAVPVTGAYCRSLASTYNHVPRAAVVAVRSGEARVILRRETEDDLLALDEG